jgi:hypothetical protein
MNRGYPWMTAGDRCLGHLGGTAGEDGAVPSLAAKVARQSTVKAGELLCR